MFCPHCGKETSADHPYCPFCGKSLAIEPGPSAGATLRGPTAWENRRTLGMLPALMATAKAVLFSPAEFFKRMPVTGGLSDPLVYGLIVGMAGLLALSLWDLALHDSLQGFMTAEMRAASERGMLRRETSFLASLFTPFLMILWLFIVSGMLHLVLLLVRGARAGYEATFRVVAYSVSPFLFLIIPVCGMPIVSVWTLVLAVIGLREAHDIPGSKAAFTVLFPFLFCCGAAFVGLMLLMGTLAASFGALMQNYR
jgi:hypothetical protein